MNSNNFTQEKLTHHKRETTEPLAPYPMVPRSLRKLCINSYINALEKKCQAL